MKLFTDLYNSISSLSKYIFRQIYVSKYTIIYN